MLTGVGIGMTAKIAGITKFMVSIRIRKGLDSFFILNTDELVFSAVFFHVGYCFTCVGSFQGF